MSTVRLARMPEKHKLKDTLSEEIAAVLEQRPDLTLVKLADGATDNWSYLGAVLPQGIETLDFYPLTILHHDPKPGVRAGRSGHDITSVFIPLFTLQSIAIGLIKYKNPIAHFSIYKNKRGMSIYHDWIDWLGGYPFEVAKPEEIFNLYKIHRYILEEFSYNK